MTLLIGTVSKKNIILTSDGLSRANPKTGMGTSSTSFQKIFPLPEVPIAIVHHGLNILNRRPISLVINEFIGEYTNIIEKQQLLQITSTLLKFVNDDAIITLQDPTNEGVICFWVAGFNLGKKKPKLYEICWPNDLEPRSHRNLVMGGDGKSFINHFLEKPIDKFSPTKVYNYNTNLARQYHEILYNEAEHKQTEKGSTLFGGHKQQLLINKKEWSWIIAPQ